MLRYSLKIITSSLLALGLQSTAFAHTGGAVLGADGSNPSATALAAITCFNDGNGEPAGLFVEIQDLSPPVAGLLLSVQLYKGAQATNITDTVSGDGNYSQGIQLDAGAGTYQVILNKTNAGARAFDLVWHCVTANGTHTGTDIVIRQFQ